MDGSLRSDRERSGLRSSFVVALLFLVGCDGSPTAPVAEDDTPLVFDIEAFYEFAWIGMMIDESGAVWSYDQGGRSPLDCENLINNHLPGACPGDRIAGSVLRAKAERGRSPLGALPPAEVSAQRARIEDVVPFSFRSPRPGCPDAGVFSFAAYRYDRGTDTYSIVLLRHEGAQVRQNDSPAALEITRWLLEALELHPDIHREHQRFVANDACHPD